MKCSNLIVSALTLICVTSALEAIRQYAPPDETELGPKHMRADVRYTSPKGIGYNTGYTTLEGFFSPKAETWLPFFDGRLHIFDDGKFAANAGVGLRYLGEKRIWGANAYYDYRKTNRQAYNQIAAGLESLGRIWDFRINGYLPLGTTHSRFYHTKFDFFKNHNMFIRRTRNFAMKGFNAEAALHVDHFKHAPLYFAAGPYYLTGVGASTWGGELRGVVELLNRHLKLEAVVAYDHFFKWTGQGQISLNYSFGPREKIAKTRACSQALTLEHRAVQRVDRDEIIPVGKQHVSSKAINPATGQPFFFLFVNNTSTSDGSYENPYHDFATVETVYAPNQVIYVFPGDGTSRGMNMGITLLDGQFLLGSSSPQALPTTLGTITIPAQTSGLPNITTASGNVVTAANNNTISGFFIALNSESTNGIVGDGISNLIASQNTIVFTAIGTKGIELLDSCSTVVVNNSSFSGFPGLSSFGIFNQGTVNDLNVTGCSFNDFINVNGGILNAGMITDLNVTGCSFNNFINSSWGVINLGTVTNVNIAGCSFSGFVRGGNGGSDGFSHQGTSITNLNITGCSFSNFGNLCAGVVNAHAGPITSINVTNCSFSDFSNNSEGIVNVGPVTSINIEACSFSDCNGEGIQIRPPGTVSSMTINDNFFSGGSAAGNGYGATISINMGTACLEFIGNSATPVNSPVPYVFTGTGGTFNRTAGSDESTNTGTFMLTNVNPAGSCSQ